MQYGYNIWLQRNILKFQNTISVIVNNTLLCITRNPNTGLRNSRKKILVNNTHIWDFVAA